jgi:hypothetical protein
MVNPDGSTPMRNASYCSIAPTLLWYDFYRYAVTRMLAYSFLRRTPGRLGVDGGPRTAYSAAGRGLSPASLALCNSSRSTRRSTPSRESCSCSI